MRVRIRAKRQLVRMKVRNRVSVGVLVRVWKIRAWEKDGTTVRVMVGVALGLGLGLGLESG